MFKIIFCLQFYVFMTLLKVGFVHIEWDGNVLFICLTSNYVYILLLVHILNKRITLSHLRRRGTYAYSLHMSNDSKIDIAFNSDQVLRKPGVQWSSWQPIYESRYLIPASGSQIFFSLYM